MFSEGLSRLSIVRVRDHPRHLPYPPAAPSFQRPRGGAGGNLAPGRPPVRCRRPGPGPIASDRPHCDTYRRAIPVACWMSLAAPVVTLRVASEDHLLSNAPAVGHHLNARLKLLSRHRYAVHLPAA